MLHNDLFDGPVDPASSGMETYYERHPIAIDDGSLCYYRNFIHPDRQSGLLAELVSQIDWQRPIVTLFGKQFQTPRQVAYYGDPDAEYRYSGVVHQPLAWLPCLECLRNQISELTEHSFNAVLVNYYSNGSDHMGWHADNERELGVNPCIASLSLGARRDFAMKHRGTGERKIISLESGSLLMMSGVIQQYWLHSLPKRTRIMEDRLNLTFRLICR